MSSLADPAYYVEEDHMGESAFQFFCSHRLVELLAYYFEAAGTVALVSGNQFVHFEKGNPAANLAPDVYVILGETLPAQGVKSWKLWEHGGKGPDLAVEIVSEAPAEAAKDYDPATLAKYQRMGVKELLRYDPLGDGTMVAGMKRQLFTLWSREDSGALVEQPSGRRRVKSRLFDFWYVHAADRWHLHAERQLRIGVGPDGLSLFPTRTEAALLRADEEARRAEEAEAREAVLLAEIERLRAGAPAPSNGEDET